MTAEAGSGAPRRGRVRLLALDVDGTLLTSHHDVSSVVAAAVRRAAASGLRIVLTTARPPRGLLPVLAALAEPGAGAGPGIGRPEVTASPVAAFVASQGALTGHYGPDGVLIVLASAPMPAHAALACVRALPPGVTANWFAGERWLVAGLDPLVEREASIVGFRPEVVDLTGEVQGPEKLLLLAAEDRTDGLDRVVLPAGLAAVRSTPTHLEVTRAGVDKATALAGLCARLGVARHEVAAMGDGRNDLAMLDWAGTAMVPANAAVEVQQVADLVTADNNADGVAEAIAWLLGG